MIQEFRAKFNFRPEMTLYLGVEREYFLSEIATGKVVPKAKEVLDHLGPVERFSYELSACQIESKDGPCLLQDLKSNLEETHQELSEGCFSQGVRLNYFEVAPEDMPLDVYPDPSGRYQEISKKLPEDVLRAACRVAGTHIHVGMPDHDTALNVYNKVTFQLPDLIQRGDNSSGERMELYRMMAPDSEPCLFKNWNDFYAAGVRKGYTEDPRKLYSLIRISVHGTIEFRMFGVASDTYQVLEWARACHELCKEAMT